MSLLDERSAQTNSRDLVLMCLVETLREQREPATPRAVASMIGGAEVRHVGRALYRLAEMGLVSLEPGKVPIYALTLMGAELLSRDLEGWTPGRREQSRRDAELLSATTGALRTR